MQSSRPLNNLTAIERRIAAGEKPEDIPDNEDLFGARFMTPEKRAQVRSELEGNVAGSVKGIAERQKDINQLPPPPEVEKVANAKTFREGWDAFKEHPIKVIAHLGAESAALSAPGILGSLAAGPVAGLTIGATAAGLGSYGVDYASEILDGLRDAKVDLTDEGAIKKAMSDPALMEKIGQKAHAHAVPVAALDAASMKMAGASLLPKAVRPSNVVAEKLAELPLQAPLQGAMGGLGEFAGQQAAGDEVKPGAIIAEVLGEFAGTPHEAATAVMSKPHAAGAAVAGQPSTPVTAADVEGQVAAGGIQVAPDPGGPTQPMPTDTPVTTTSGGVNTTTTLHGPAEAYTVAPDEVGKPTLKPTAMPIEDIAAQVAGTQQQIPPQAAERSEPVQGLYSRLRSWVEEKGPSKLPAHEWLAKLQGNNAFKGEELQDLQLPAYFEGRRGQHVTKEEVLAQVDAMTAPLVEVTRTPMSPEDKIAQQAAIEAQIRAVATANQLVDPATGVIDLAHPMLASLVEQYTNVEDAAGWAKYGQYTTPGPRESYTELTLHLPSRGATVKPENVALGQVKVVGEDTYGYHYAEPNEVVLVRMTTRTGINGERIALLEEGQSDVLQALKAGAEIPDMVYKQGWPALGVTRFLMWAAQNGYTHIAWVNSAEQMRRYPLGTAEQVASCKRGMEHFYDKVIPGIMKRFARDLGGTVTTTMIPDTAYEVRPWGMDPATGVVTAWGVFDPRRQTPVMTSADQVYAEEFAQRNTAHSTFQSMELPQLAIDTINMGMPTYSKEEPAGATMAPVQPGGPRTVQALVPLTKALDSLIKKLNLGISLKIVAHEQTIEFKRRNAQGKMVTVEEAEYPRNGSPHRTVVGCTHGWRDSCVGRKARERQRFVGHDNP